MASFKPVDVTRLRDRLRARDQELRGVIHAALVNNGDKTLSGVADRVLDSAEQSVASLLTDTRISLLEKEIAEQADVVAALARVTDGSYGVCTDCGEGIALARLEAYPTAKRCIGCQTGHETRRRGGGRDTTPSL